MSKGIAPFSVRYAALLSEAKRATHAVDGALLDRTDLADLVDRLRHAVEELAGERDQWLAERAQLSGRLTRSSHLPPRHPTSDDSGVFTFAPPTPRSELRNNDGASLAAPPHAADGDSGLGPMS